MLLVERIKSLCVEKNMSVRKLELEIGLSTSSISKWAKSSPSVDALQKIAEYFQVSLDYLYGNTKYRNFQEQISDIYISDYYCDNIGLIEMQPQNEDIEKRIKALLTYVKQADSMLFSGKQADPRTRELFIISLLNLLENTRNDFLISESLPPIRE